MNIVKRIMEWSNWSFRKFFMITGMVCYIILQIICVSINLSSINQQVDLLNEKETLNQHNVIMNQFYELYYNLEIVKKFIEGNEHLYHKKNVNLISDENKMEVFQETTLLFDRLVVDSGIIQGVICVADNANGKGFYYDFPQEILREEPVPTWEELKSSGLEDMLNQGLFSISRRNVEWNGGGSASLAWLCNAISGEYIYYDILEECPVIILLNPDYINEIAGRFKLCDIAIYEHTNILRFSLEGTLDETEGFYEHYTSYFLGDLSIRTKISKTASVVDENQMTEAYRKLFVVALLCSVAVFFLLFGAVHLLEKNLKVICEIMKKQTEASEFLHIARKNKRWSLPFSAYIFLGFLIPCIIGVLSCFAHCNYSFNQVLNAGVLEYVENAVADYATVFDRTFQRYGTFIACKDVESKVKSGEFSSEQLDIAYQSDVLSSTNYLPGYFYSVLVDENQENLSQTMFASNTLLDERDLNVLCQRADTYGKNPCLMITSDSISLQPKIVYLKKISEQNKTHGYCLFFMDFPRISNQQDNDFLTIDFYLKEGETSVNLDSLVSFNKREMDTLYTKELSIASEMPVENSTFSLVAYGDKADYLQRIRQIQNYMFVFLIMLMIIFAFIADFLKNILVDSFNELIRNMEKIPQYEYAPIMKTTGIEEFNIITDAYNKMVMRLEELLKENVDKAVENKELELLQIKTEFQMLQHQINPHFLFNTLECINQMTICHEDEKVTEMIQDLSSILRYVLKQSNLVQVSAEIKVLKAYVSILEFRMEESNLQFLFDIDETLCECVMIKFILQPLVENSVLHGVVNKENPVIKITLCDWENGIEFVVSDNGIGMTEEELSALWEKLDKGIEGNGQSSSGIGLANVYRRIKLYYGDESDFVIESKKGVGTQITIRLPFVL